MGQTKGYAQTRPTTKERIPSKDELSIDLAYRIKEIKGQVETVHTL